MKRSANKYRTPKAQENIRELEKQLSFKERLFSILAFKRGINRLSKWTLIVVLSLAAIVGLTYTVRCIFDSAYGSEIQNVNYTSKHNILSKQQVMHMLGISDDTDLDSLPIDELISKLNNHPAINATSEKVDNCFKGAAMAIGCEAEIVNAQGYLPCPERLPDQVMWDAAAALGDDVKVVPIHTGVCNTASTDVGDLFAVMPVLNFTFGGSTGALHSKDFRVTDPNVAHILPAKMMALLTYHLLKDGAVEAKKIIDEYEAPYTKEQYKAYVKKISG